MEMSQIMEIVVVLLMSAMPTSYKVNGMPADIYMKLLDLNNQNWSDRCLEVFDYARLSRKERTPNAVYNYLSAKNSRIQSRCTFCTLVTTRKGYRYAELSMCGGWSGVSSVHV